MKKYVLAFAALMSAGTLLAAAPCSAQAVPVVDHHTITVEGRKMFYREAGPKDGPVILLLHGFPASSFMYRNLMPQLADKYRLIAPDLPGYGFSDIPDRKTYAFTFDNLSRSIDLFTQAMGLKKYVLLVQDYGGPVGYRLALAHPERVTAIVSQNGSAYAEGIIDPDWNSSREAWANPTPKNREALRELITYDFTKHIYVAGEKDPARIPPETYTLEYALMQRPGNDQIQLDLALDFGSELKAYPKYQAYFRKYQPPLLAVWGKNDPFFNYAAAEAFKRDLPKAEIHLYESGHFLLETRAAEVGAEIHRFLDAVPAVQNAR